jgi:hypothetical protein
MAGISGRFGPPGNQNAFRHGLAGIAQRRSDGVLNPTEQSIRQEILSGLLTAKVELRRSVQPARARNQDDPIKESSYFLFHKDAVRVF